MHYTRETETSGETLAIVVNLPTDKVSDVHPRYWVRFFAGLWIGNAPVTDEELALNRAQLSPLIPTEHGWTAGTAPPQRQREAE